jgi:hypothetical protein
VLALRIRSRIDAKESHPDLRCEGYVEVKLLRLDRANRDDKTGTLVCEECPEWLIEAGKFEKITA